MRRVLWRPRALRSLRGVWDWIAAYDREKADRIVDDLFVRVEKLLRDQPFAGRAIGGGIRQFGFDDFVIRYRVSETEVRIVRLYEGGQSGNE